MIERDSVRAGGTTIHYEVHRSKRRRKTAKITVEDGIVRIFVPWNTQTRVARKIVREKAQLILDRLNAAAPPERTGKGNERDSITYEGTTIVYEVRRSRRREKSIGMTLENGIVKLAAPQGTSSDKLRTMVRDWAPQVADSLSLAPPEGVQKRFVSGEYMPYMGEYVRLIIRSADVPSPVITFDGTSGSEEYSWVLLDQPEDFSKGERLFRRIRFGDRLDDARFRITVPPNMKKNERHNAVRDAFIEWYHKRAAEKITKCVDYHWPEIGRKNKPPILVRDQRRQWGSCAADGTLRFNWRMIMLDPDLIEYIVAHELAHLRVRSHSPRFWDRVADMVGDVGSIRRRLRRVEGVLPL